MANDVNKSKLLSQVNSLKEKYDRPGVIESKHILDRDVARGTLHDLQNTIKNRQVNGGTISSAEFTEITNDIGYTQDDIARHQRHIDSSEMGRSRSLGRAWENRVNNYAGPIQSTRRINEVAGSSSTIVNATQAKMSGNISYPHLERAREKLQAEIEQARGGLSMLASEGPDVDPNALITAEKRLLRAETKVGNVDARMKVLKRSGLSTEALLDRVQNSASFSESALSSLGQEGARKQIAEGKTLRIEDLNSAIKKAAEELRQAGTELSEALLDTSKDAKDINAAIKKESDAREKLEKTEETKKIAGQEGKIAQSGFMGKVANILTGGMGGKAIDIMHGVADVANAAGRGFRYFGIESVAQKMQNQIGLAGIANDQYNDVRSGLENLDVAAMRRAMGTNELALRAGNSAATYEKTASIADLVEATSRGVGNAAQAGMNVSPGQFAGNSAQGLVNVGIAGHKMFTGAQATAVGLQMRNQARAVGEATNYVRDTINQSYVDFSMGTAGTTMGLGSRNAMMDMLQQSGARNALAEKGLSGKRLLGTLDDLGQLGAVGADEQMYTLNRAAQIQQNGTMSAAQYIGSQASLSSVGGSGGQLEKIMKEAVAAGMESAKNINQMVSATVDLSQSMAAVGIGGTNFMSQSLGSAVQNLGNLDPNQRVGVAQNTLAQIQRDQTDTGYNLYTVMEYSRLRRTNPNADKNELDILKQTSEATLQDIKTSKDPNKAAIAAGLFSEGLLKGKNGELDFSKLESNIMDKRLGTAARTNQFGRGIMSDEEMVVATQKAGGNLNLMSGDLANSINRNALLTGKNGAVVVSSMAGSVAQQKDLTSVSGTAEQAMKIQQSQAVGNNNNINAGQNNLGSLSPIVDAMKKLSEESPIKFAEAAEKAAESMKQPADIFMKSAGTFDSAVTRFEKIIDEKLNNKVLTQLKTQLDSQTSKIKK